MPYQGRAVDVPNQLTAVGPMLGIDFNVAHMFVAMLIAIGICMLQFACGRRFPNLCP